MFSQLGNAINDNHFALRYRKDKWFKSTINLLPFSFTPNRVTFFRFIIALIWLPFAILKPSLWQIFIFLFIYYLDLLDGAVARIRNQETYLGHYFDLWADYLNGINLLIVILFFFQLKTLALFIFWNILMSIFLAIEYFWRKSSWTIGRIFINFGIRLIFWILLIIEAIAIY